MPLGVGVGEEEGEEDVWGVRASGKYVLTAGLQCITTVEKIA